MNGTAIFLLGGMAVGILIAVILIYVCNSNGKIKTDYDERQEAIRGRGYKYAMITAWLLLGAYIVLEIGEVKVPVENAVMLFTILIISLLVQISHAIWNDAYFGGNNKAKSYIFTILVIAILNTFITVNAGMHNELIVDGILSWRAIQGVCAIALFIAVIEAVIKLMLDKKAEEED